MTKGSWLKERNYFENLLEVDTNQSTKKRPRSCLKITITIAIPFILNIYLIINQVALQSDIGECLNVLKLDYKF